MANQLVETTAEMLDLSAEWKVDSRAEVKGMRLVEMMVLQRVVWLVTVRGFLMVASKAVWMGEKMADLLDSYLAA